MKASSPTTGRLNLLTLNLQRSTLLAFQSLTRRLHRGSKLPPHLEVGVRGELEALFFLRRLGYIVVERRWRSPEHNGDLDLIAWEDETLAVIEVKTRSTRDLTPAALAVDDAKRRMLRRMARSYLRTLPHAQRESPGFLLRFDLVSVYLTPTGAECELLRDIQLGA
jgi:putative endonuclease